MGVGLSHYKKKTPQEQSDHEEIKRCADTDEHIVGVPVIVEVVEAQIPLVAVPIETRNFEIAFVEPKYAICHP